MINNNGVEMRVFSGTAHPKLAQDIAQYLGIELGKMRVSKFACGEIFVNIEESVRGKNVFIIQTAGPDVNNNLMEMFIMMDAFKRASAASIQLVIPHYGYARQDKKAGPREPISARLTADLMEKIGCNRVITMDLHSDQIQGYFSIPVDHLFALPLFVRYFENKKIKDLVVVAPDTGRAKTCKRLADSLGADLAIVHKSRPKHNVAEVMHLVGDVNNKTVLLFDDMVDTAGSIVSGLEVLKQHGCNDEIYLAATHPVFSNPATERLTKAGFKEVVVMDTIPVPAEKRFPGLKVLSPAPLFGEAIQRAHQNRSVSEIFEH